MDSALVAALAERPCIAIGLAGSHDLRRAEHVARELNLHLDTRPVTKNEIEATLPLVLDLLIDPSPVDLAIATTFILCIRNCP